MWNQNFWRLFFLFFSFSFFRNDALDSDVSSIMLLYCMQMSRQCGIRVFLFFSFFLFLETTHSIPTSPVRSKCVCRFFCVCVCVCVKRISFSCCLHRFFSRTKKNKQIKSAKVFFALTERSLAWRTRQGRTATWPVWALRTTKKKYIDVSTTATTATTTTTTTTTNRKPVTVISLKTIGCNGAICESRNADGWRSPFPPRVRFAWDLVSVGLDGVVG